MSKREKTHRFKRNEAIDCREWLEFTIVETTMSGFRIRFVSEVEEEIDKPKPPAVESVQQTI